jgi:hypothetical protein
MTPAGPQNSLFCACRKHGRDHEQRAPNGGSRILIMKAGGYVL